MEVVGFMFIITGAGIQHGVMLQRRMLFGVSAIIEISALLIGTVVSVGMAMAGYGYWALVSMTITLPLATTIGLWIATGWIPGRPQMVPAVRSMLRFGLRDDLPALSPISRTTSTNCLSAACGEPRRWDFMGGPFT